MPLSACVDEAGALADAAGSLGSSAVQAVASDSKSGTASGFIGSQRIETFSGDSFQVSSEARE